jgi:Do/DeqQ family serine protease
MKSVGKIVIVSVLSAIITAGIYNHFTTEKIVIKEVDNTPVQLAANHGSLSQLPDLTYAAEKSVNSVVHVKSVMLNEQYRVGYNPIYEFFYGHAPIQKEYVPSLTSGSGVIISADGFIVTNNHVIKNAEKIQVTLNNKKTYEAKVVGTDPSTDIALLKIDAENLPYIPYGNSDEIKLGEWVLAVGNPFNLTSTVTAGIVSAKGRDINILDYDPVTGYSPIETFIQTDAAVNPGNSGGALVNAKGELIGINTAIKSNTGSYTGYSFAIPVNIVKKVVDDLIEFGVVQRAYMGVKIQEVDEEIASKFGLKEVKGVFINDIIPHGAAEEAGLKSGDIIVKIGAIDINGLPELQEQLGKFRPGDEILVTIIRNQKELEYPVVLRNKNGEVSLTSGIENQSTEILGAYLEPVSKNEMQKLRISNGLKVKQLKPGKLLYAGVREGFIITKIDRKPVYTFNDVEKILKNKNGGVLIEGIYPNGQKAYYGFGV